MLPPCACRGVFRLYPLPLEAQRVLFHTFVHPEFDCGVTLKDPLPLDKDTAPVGDCYLGGRITFHSPFASPGLLPLSRRIGQGLAAQVESGATVVRRPADRAWCCPTHVLAARPGACGALSGRRAVGDLPGGLAGLADGRTVERASGGAGRGERAAHRRQQLVVGDRQAALTPPPQAFTNRPSRGPRPGNPLSRNPPLSCATGPGGCTTTRRLAAAAAAGDREGVEDAASAAHEEQLPAAGSRGAWVKRAVVLPIWLPRPQFTPLGYTLYPKGYMPQGCVPGVHRLPAGSRTRRVHAPQTRSAPRPPPGGSRPPPTARRPRLA